MKTILAAALLAAAASVAPAAPITTTLHLVRLGATTHPIIYDGEYDIYTVVAHNPNPTRVIALEIDLRGYFLQVGGGDFNQGLEPPPFTGLPSPDTYFTLPEGVEAHLALGVNVIDTETRLAASYTTQGARDLVPALGSMTIALLSVPGGAPVTLPPVLGRADIGGRLASVVHVPEPSTAVVTALALFGLAARRR